MTYQDYKKMLLDQALVVKGLKKQIEIVADRVNSWVNELENTNFLEELGRLEDFEVQKWNAIAVDCWNDWYMQNMLDDPDLPHWNPEDIILNKQAFKELKEQRDAEDLDTFNMMMANARPYNENKLKAEYAKKKKKKEIGRKKNSIARKSRKV